MINLFLFCFPATNKFVALMQLLIVVIIRIIMGQMMSVGSAARTRTAAICWVCRLWVGAIVADCWRRISTIDWSDHWAGSGGSIRTNVRTWAICSVCHVEEGFGITNKFVHVPFTYEENIYIFLFHRINWKLFTGYFLHDSFLVVVTQASRQLVIVHGRSIFLQTPSTCHLFGFNQFEFHSSPSPRYASGTV